MSINISRHADLFLRLNVLEHRKAWGAYNTAFACDIFGSFRIERLTKCLSVLTRKYKQLDPVQDGVSIELQQVSFFAVSCGRSVLRKTLYQPFDLKTQSPTRIHLWASATQTRLLIIIHHSVIDAWGWGVLLLQLWDLYEGKHLSVAPSTSFDGMAKHRGDAASFWNEWICETVTPNQLRSIPDMDRQIIGVGSSFRKQVCLPSNITRLEQSAILLEAFANTLLTTFNLSLIFISCSFLGRHQKQLNDIASHTSTIPIPFQLREEPFLARIERTAELLLSAQLCVGASLEEIRKKANSLGVPPFSLTSYHFNLTPDTPWEPLSDFLCGERSVHWPVGDSYLVPIPLRQQEGQNALTLGATKTSRGVNCVLKFQSAFIDKHSAAKLLGEFCHYINFHCL